jgi:hypothetical protein
MRGIGIVRASAVAVSIGLPILVGVTVCYRREYIDRIHGGVVILLVGIGVIWNG